MADISRLPGRNEGLWEWQLHARFRGMDSGWFFHPEAERGPQKERRDADGKAICAQCPVIDPCREHALQVQEPYGVWGGMTVDERLLRRATPKAIATGHVDPVVGQGRSWRST